ncbi:MAG: Redoxin domain protein [Acidimicrobiales bacterium]|nr:Redoxin domain protein [Acidimicrobiales bacterium]
MERVLLTVITDEEAQVDGGRDGDRLLVAEADLSGATGWALKPQGLCRDDTCMPVHDRVALGPDGWIDVAAFATAVGRPVALEPSLGFVALGAPAHERAVALASLDAPHISLPTVAGGTASVHDLSGRKRLVVAFASWCGCRHDLPVWQGLHERWADEGFSVVAVAVDQAAEDVAPYVEAARVTFPVLVDADHRFVDAYGIVNVPTAVWIDEGDRIVRPNTAAFGNDEFVDFHGVPSAPHLAALERWVVGGEVPFADDVAVRAAQMLPDDAAQQARTEFRLALALHRAGHEGAAGRHFDDAGRLAPFDFTIRRAAMPLRGQDPFGEPFFELYEEWSAAGRPYYSAPSIP